MAEKRFDTGSTDSQGTVLAPLDPKKFDVERYADYEADLLAKSDVFWQASQGLAVYRRFRVPQVFSGGCKDMKQSLALQLAGLRASMDFEADIPNFLEPWYGIGIAASAFGATYVWEDDSAPAIAAPFTSVDQALQQEIVPIEQTEIGRHTLDMIEYFLEQTRGKIPMSMTDTQSALNAASFLIETNSFYMELFDNPEGMEKLLSLITDLTLDFSRKQKELIGDALVLPGHGFPSARCFEGMGMSTDVMLTISDDLFKSFEVPCQEKLGNAFGGAVFHSCGNWSNKIDSVKSISNLLMVDGAFSSETDPDANPVEPFENAFADTGVIVNARIVGDEETIVRQASALWSPGSKLIITTYCPTAAEQKNVYESLKNLVQTR
jgi:hypothetical protein